jgi:riboflavin biosynthesis pyrimidine reductase
LRSLAAASLLDEIHLTIAPVIFGGVAAPTLTGLPADFLPKPLDFEIAACEQREGECFLHLKINRRARKGK